MANKIDLKILYRGLQTKMMAELGLDRSSITHSGTKGTASERCWIDFFRKYLPKIYSVDSGFVIDHKGNRSDQIDIIIYDSNFAPLVLNQGGCLYIPVECVLAIFEVKQKINLTNCTYTTTKAQSVRELRFSYDGGAKDIILAGILSTECAWSQKSLDTYAKSQTGITSLDFVCSIDNVCLYVIYNDAPWSLYEGRKYLNHRLKFGKKRNANQIEIDSDVFALFTFFYQLCHALSMIRKSKTHDIDFNKYLSFLDATVEPFDSVDLLAQ